MVGIYGWRSGPQGCENQAECRVSDGFILRLAVNLNERELILIVF